MPSSWSIAHRSSQCLRRLGRLATHEASWVSCCIGKVRCQSCAYCKLFHWFCVGKGPIDLCLGSWNVGMDVLTSNWLVSCILEYCTSLFAFISWWWRGNWWRCSIDYISILCVVYLHLVASLHQFNDATIYNRGIGCFLSSIVVAILVHYVYCVSFLRVCINFTIMWLKCLLI